MIPIEDRLNEYLSQFGVEPVPHPFLHVEVALAIGKLRRFGRNWRKGKKMNSYAHGFLDIADARVIFAVLARGEVGPCPQGVQRP